MSLNASGLWREKVMISGIKALKKIFSTEESEESGKKTQIMDKITREQLTLRLNSKWSENLEKQEKFKKNIFASIQQFDTDIQEVLLHLENVNVEERRDHEKVKLVVKENLNLYIAHLKRLGPQLKEIADFKAQKVLNAQEYLNNILQCLDEFGRKSYPPFEKATLLVGNELAAAKTLIKGLITEINATAQNYRAVFEESELMSQLVVHLDKLKSNELSVADLDRHIRELDGKLATAQEEVRVIKTAIENIKASEQYRQDGKAQEEYQQQLRVLDQELQRARQQINLKFMAKYFHHDHKKSQLIKAYFDNFPAALEQDQNLSIIGLVKESLDKDFKASQHLDLNSWKEIQSKVSEMKRPFLTKTGQEIAHLEATVTALEVKIAGMAANIIQETKKKEKMVHKEEEILGEVNRYSHSLFKDITVIGGGS